MKRYFTTPIYYASGAPHLGHAYTTLVADAYRRHRALLGDDVMLVTGADEHGQKIERAALAAGMRPRDFVDARSAAFEQLWHDLGIGVDRFERTTGAAHIAFARRFWLRLAARGDIYAGEYAGRYCIECEQYFTESEVCPVHGRPLESFREPSYFFRLSRYRQALIRHIETHDDFILPTARRNEVLTFLRANALRDLSISRVSTRWGIPVPGDPAHVMYVWIDALASYLSVLAPDGDAGDDDAVIETWWNGATHFIGKDILTFHAIYWPALLMSAGLALPRSLVVNGWLTAFGRKIAKSEPETIIDPRALTARVGRDGLRWYLLRRVSLGQDVDFSDEDLVQTVNSDLANNLGNLFSRFTVLAARRLGAEWPCSPTAESAAVEIRETISRTGQTINAGFDAGNPAISARAFLESGAAINAFFQQQAPWQIADEVRLRAVLGEVYHGLCDLSVMGLPFVPDAMTRARTALGLDNDAAWEEIGRRHAVARVREAGPLFPRIAAG